MSSPSTNISPSFISTFLAFVTAGVAGINTYSLPFNCEVALNTISPEIGKYPVGASASCIVISYVIPSFSISI